MAQSPQLYSAGVAFHLVLYLEQPHQPTRYQPQHFSLGLGSKVFSIYAITCLLLSQYEGASHEGGKGRNIWDTFTAKHPGPLFLSEPWFISLACQPEDFLILFSVFSKVTMCYIKSPCT